MDNLQIAQEINTRIGNSPVPFDSVYSIALAIYQELGGEGNDFDSVYSILLEILPLASETAHVIDDSSISLTKTWSSSKISSELTDAGFKTEFVEHLPATGDVHTLYFVPSSGAQTGNTYDEFMWNASASEWEQVGSTAIDTSNYYTKSEVDELIDTISNTANSDIEGKETIDFTFVNELPVSGEEGQYVIIHGENQDALYEYTSGEWVLTTPDATKLYFNTETEALYSYVSADSQFAPVSLVNSIVVGSNLNNNTALKAIKTPGVYNVVQRLHNATKGDYIKNWTLTVESVDYEEYDKSDSIYQRIQSNYTIQKRTWSSTRATNDGWSSFSTYYAGEIKDSTVSKYYTWSSNKLNASLEDKQDTLTAGAGIDISNGIISATGGGGSVDMMVEVTYAELKALRDNKQLVPGQQYRITDYVTTTAQANTQSAGHQFDIIVVADSEDKLNENARAINHIFDTSGATTYYKWFYSSDEVDPKNAYYYLTSQDTYEGGEVAGICEIVCPVEGMNYYTVAYEFDGCITSDGSETDYMNPANAILRTEVISGETKLIVGDYINEEKWQMWVDEEEVTGEYPEWFRGKYFLNTYDAPCEYKGTYQEGTDSYFDNSKLESWELKYCLDNDNNRFGWVSEGNEGAIRVYDGGEYYIYRRYALADDANEFAWVYVMSDYTNPTIDDIDNWNSIDTGDIIYSESLTITVGDTIGGYTVNDYSATAGIPNSKGVIYYMKDEFNNQCYFDFKNIKIYNNRYSYVYLFGDADSGYQSNKDCTINGDSYNNIVVDGEVNDGTMYIDTTMFLFNQVGYQNIVDIPEYTAGNSVIRINNNSIYGSTINSISNGGIICNYDNANNIYSISVDYDYFVQYIFSVINKKQEYNSLPNNEKYLTIKALENNTNVTYTGTKTIEYSVDLINWKSINNSKTITLLTIGSEVYIRGNNSNYDSCKIQTDKKSKYYGNIMALINSEDFKNLTILESGNAFHSFFSGSKVQDASELLLPATTLTNRCYQGMFSHCTELTSVPELPATTLADYCYEDMFVSCTSLTTAPELPATTLTQWCYGDMFNGCTNLNYVKCLATSVSAHKCTRSWLNGVSSTGTFITPSLTNWSTGVDGIPSDWTRVDSDAVSNT